MQSAVESLEILETLINDDSDDNQLEIMHKITDLFMVTADKHKPQDTEVFGVALNHVAYQLAPEQRQQLSERIASHEKAPHNLIIKLANDHILVAEPVLQQSPCLNEADLTTIIDAKGAEHQLAICHRSEIPVSVTDALIKTGQENVLCAVVENKGAKLSSEGILSLSQQAKTLGVLQETLGNRPDIAIHNQKDMANVLKQKIKDELFHKVSEIVDNNIEHIIDVKLAELNGKEARPQYQNKKPSAKGINQTPKLPKSPFRLPVDQKREMSEFALTGHARARRMSETVKTLSALTHISEQMAMHCMFYADLSALGILCKANHFSRETFAALLQLRVIHKKLPKSVVADALQRYDVLSYQKALKVMDFVEKRLKEESKNTASLEMEFET